MKRPALIPGWRQAHRLWTVRLAVALCLLNLMGALLTLLAEDFPSRAWLYVNTVLAALIGAVRLVQQSGVLDGPDAPERQPPQTTEPAAAGQASAHPPSEQ